MVERLASAGNLAECQFPMKNPTNSPLLSIIEMYLDAIESGASVWGGNHPSGWFPVARKPEESDLSHLSNLSDIICGHFDDKNWGGDPLLGGGGGKVG